MPNTKRVDKELMDALEDVRFYSFEYGQDATFLLHAESAITRDSYGSVKSKNTPTTTIVLEGSPVNHNPTARDYEHAGLKNQGDCIIYTPVKVWQSNSIGFNDIDIVRTSVILEGRTYEVIDKNKTGQIGVGFLYFAFSLKTR